MVHLVDATNRIPRQRIRALDLVVASPDHAPEQWAHVVACLPAGHTLVVMQPGDTTVYAVQRAPQ